MSSHADRIALSGEEFVSLAGLVDDGILGARVALRPLTESRLPDDVEMAAEVVLFKLEEARLWLGAAVEKHATNGYPHGEENE